MLSTIPVDLSKVHKTDLQREILRVAIIAELDAVSLYEQMASLAGASHLRNVLLDVAKEEKTHVGEFQAMLLRLDEEQAQELINGQIEVDKRIVDILPRINSWDSGVLNRCKQSLSNSVSSEGRCPDLKYISCGV